MNQEETLELWKQCEQARAAVFESSKGQDAAHEAAKAIWNSWANSLLEKREELEQTGEWDTKSSATFSTTETTHHFGKDADFSGFIFPGYAQFDNATFKGEAWFGSATFEGVAWFGNAAFKDSVHFENATFENDAWFGNATFEGGVQFESAAFEGVAQFESATFKGGVQFESTTFKGYVRFGSATFEGVAWFGNAAFEGVAWFNNATFKDDVRFTQTTFNSYTSFQETTFEKDAEFVAIKAERAFTLENTQFNKIPDFIQANFTEAPRLDNANFNTALIQPRSFWANRIDDVTWLFTGKRLEKVTGTPDPNLPARYRALKRLAVQGHDTDHELEFNAAEIISRRYVEDFPRRKNVGRFWFGTLYQGFSNFGRSLARPFCWWAFLTLIFAVIYWGPRSGRPLPEWSGFPAKSYSQIGILQGLKDTYSWAGPCKDVVNRYRSTPEKKVYTSLDTNAVWEAFAHSFRNATLVLSLTDQAAQWRSIGCLYGSSKDSPFVRNMPPTASAFGALQRFLSAILIFLFGIALRNMLKMK